MNMNHLRHIPRATHGVEDLQMGLVHLSSIHSQIFKLFLHVIEEEAVNVVEKDVHCHVCSDMTYCDIFMFI